MRGVSKKILISLLTTLVVFITVFATTYAWVGIFTYANSDSFKMNLKVQDLNTNYFLTICGSGNKEDFGDKINSIELERQIVKNMSYNSMELNDEALHSLFNTIVLNPCTTFVNNENKLDSFKEISYVSKTKYEFVETSNDYYKFDLYLSVDTKEGISETTTGIKANIIIDDIANCLEGTICQGRFLNGNPYIDLPSSSIYNELSNIPDLYKVNSKNAVRFAFEIYNPINIDDDYTNEKPIKTIIYQGGKEIPYYVNEGDYYDLGGCLPFDYNTALNELLVLRPGYIQEDNLSKLENEFSKVIDRNDLELVETNAYIWNKNDHLDTYLGCMNGIQTKIKISTYLWFEGWDADCLKTIVDQPITLNLTFTSGIDD